MRSFTDGFIEQQPVSQNLLQTIRKLGEFKGRQQLFYEQSPQVLKMLQQNAAIESTEASNRIEGVTAPHQRIAELVARTTNPKNRPEQEIAGYRDALGSIHVNHEHTAFSAKLVLSVHRDLYKFSTGEGGRWKRIDNDITQTLPDGKKISRFKPVPAAETAKAMEKLHERFDELWNDGDVEPLLLIP